MRIKELPKNDMPYEKLERFGERSLTESELLAIIIRNGNKNNNSIQIAQKILGEEHLKFRDIFYKSLEELISYPGIGRVKAIQIKAIGEIIRRVEIPLKYKREKISSTKDVGEKYMPKLRYLKIEEMYVIFLDAKNNILKDKNSPQIENLILGANTGFLQKTIIYSLFEKEEERLEVIKKLLHLKKGDKIKDHLKDKFSPRVLNRIKINGKNYLAGLVKIMKVEEKNVGTN